MIGLGRGDEERHIKAITRVISFGMISTRAENFCRPQRPTESTARAENTLECFIWPLYVGLQSFGGRIETEAELDS